MPLTLLRHRLDARHSAPAVFEHLFAGADNVFWLDTAAGATGAAGTTGATGATGTSYLGTGEPWMPTHPVLEGLRAELAAAELTTAAPGFQLGLIGWLGYELRFETMGGTNARSPRYPEAAFLKVRTAVAIGPDGSTELLALGESWAGDVAEWRDATVAALAGIQSPPSATPSAPGQSNAQPPATPTPPPPARRHAHWRDDDDALLDHIAHAQAAIRAGDAYVLNLTTEAEVPGTFDPAAVYADLRAAAPSRHGALITIGGVSLLSSSPEVFLEITPSGRVTTHPVKGTRARSSDPAEDDRLRDELLASAKERAENTMIVDLMRNDLAKVCVPGSVTVDRMLAVETHRQVHQLVSTVVGQLRPGLDAVDAIAATLPAGSMTGTPKQRATEIIDTLENRARGLYAGAFGYLGFDGRAELAMTIRSIVIDDAGATLGVGGGITALSVPAEEVAEVKLKAAALLHALGAGAEAEAEVEVDTRRTI